MTLHLLHSSGLTLCEGCLRLLALADAPTPGCAQAAAVRRAAIAAFPPRRPWAPATGGAYNRISRPVRSPGRPAAAWCFGHNTGARGNAMTIAGEPRSIPLPFPSSPVQS